MENQRDKFRKPEEQNQQQRGTKPWADLPRDILGFILRKLPSTADVIRFRAVCKNWQIPKARVIKFTDCYCLPWVCSLSKDQFRDFKCDIFVPNSREVYKSRKSMEKFKYCKIYRKEFEVYGSKQGWLIAACFGPVLREALILMYNPYSKEMITLPSYCANIYSSFSFATFSGNPDSQDCHVFMLFQYSDRNDYRIAMCQPHVDKEWRINKFCETTREFCGMQYINGHLLFLLDDGFLRRYSLVDKTWTSLGGRRLEIDLSDELWWLIKGEGDILVACKINMDDGVCASFYFDWSNMDWVENGLPEGTTIFVCGRTGMVRRLVDNGDREDTKGSKVFFFNDGDGSKCKCYTFVGGRMMESREYGDRVEEARNRLTFIEPPPIN